MPTLEQRVRELTEQLNQARLQRQTLTQRLNEAEVDRRRAQSELAAVVDRPNPLAPRVEELKQSLADERKQHLKDAGAHAKETSVLDARVNTLEAELRAAKLGAERRVDPATHTRELATRDARIRTLETELRSAKAGAERRVDLATHAGELATRDARITALEAELRTAKAGAERRVDPATHAGELAARDARIAALEAELRAFAEAEAADDLERIRGIGPSFARALAELGVTRFSTLAAWSQDDVATIADRLGIRPSRIISSRWVEQATALADESS